LPTTSIRAFVDNSVVPHVRGFLHTPENSNGSGLVLTHGAGSNAHAPLLIALAETFSAAGFTVLRCDLPYRQTRSFGPPGPGDAARDRTGLKNAIAALLRITTEKVSGSEVTPPLSRSLRQGGNAPVDAIPNAVSVEQERRIYLGGHSYGGRQCSMLCAELAENGPNSIVDNGEADALVRLAGLLLLSYPLHPPRKPEQQRTQHLPNLHTPALFVHGTRDPFGSIAELEQALKMIPAKTKLLPIEAAGHDLGFKGKAKKEELPSLIFSEFAKFF
jgi:uncharacterized protein